MGSRRALCAEIIRTENPGLRFYSLRKKYHSVIPNTPEAGGVRYGFASHVFCAMNPSSPGFRRREIPRFACLPQPGSE